jgi:hypothetical protein
MAATPIPEQQEPQTSIHCSPPSTLSTHLLDVSLFGGEEADLSLLHSPVSSIGAADSEFDDSSGGWDAIDMNMDLPELERHASVESEQQKSMLYREVKDSLDRVRCPSDLVWLLLCISAQPFTHSYKLAQSCRSTGYACLDNEDTFAYVCRQMSWGILLR